MASFHGSQWIPTWMAPSYSHELLGILYQKKKIWIIQMNWIGIKHAPLCIRAKNYCFINKMVPGRILFLFLFCCVDDITTIPSKKIWFSLNYRLSLFSSPLVPPPHQPLHQFFVGCLVWGTLEDIRTFYIVTTCAWTHVVWLCRKMSSFYADGTSAGFYSSS